MRYIRFPLAILAAALLLAAIPDVASAASQQDCQDKWNAAPAASVCTQNLWISWWPTSGNCKLEVDCPTPDGGVQSNTRWREPVWLQYFQNCGGDLKYSCATQPTTSTTPQPRDEEDVPTP